MDYEALYEELLQFLYRTPWGLVQTSRQGDIQMLNPVAARILMPLAPHARLVNVFEVLRPVRPDLETLCDGVTVRYGMVCEDLPLNGLRQPVPADAAPASSLAISIFVQNTNCLMVVLREGRSRAQPAAPDSRDDELQALRSLDSLGIVRLQDGLITDSNPAASRLLGAGGASLAGRSLSEVVPEGQGLRLLEMSEPALLAGGRFSTRCAWALEGGPARSHEVTATPLGGSPATTLWTFSPAA